MMTTPSEPLLTPQKTEAVPLPIDAASINFFGMENQSVSTVLLSVFVSGSIWWAQFSSFATVEILKKQPERESEMFWKCQRFSVCTPVLACGTTC